MFNCVCIDADCYSEFYSPSTRTAGKSHKCGECGCEIKPGEKYEYVSAKTDGFFWTAKTCLSCARIRDDLLTCGFYHGRVWEHIHEANCGYEDDDDYFCICPE